MPKPGFIIPRGTELRPWPGASFGPGDEEALSEALTEAQIVAFIASGHLHPTLVDGPVGLSPRVLFVYPTARPDENTYTTWDAAYLAAISMTPTSAAPVAVRFPDTVMPPEIDVEGMKALHILVSDATGRGARTQDSGPHLRIYVFDQSGDTGEATASVQSGPSGVTVGATVEEPGLISLIIGGISFPAGYWMVSGVMYDGSGLPVPGFVTYSVAQGRIVTLDAVGTQMGVIAGHYHLEYWTT